MRTNLTEAVYSGYSCSTGIANFVPACIESACVFLGHKEYFVSSDIGAGKMQYYAFHKELLVVWVPMADNLERLIQIFNGRCNNVIDLLLATDEDMILRRDIYDRTPSLTWGRGRVTLLGDFIHAMQSNMGQGGCMAIEDSCQLALELSKAWKILKNEKARKLRVAIIRGMARMAAIMALTYKAYLGVGLGPLSFLTKFRIPHPGRVGGRFFIDLAIPVMLRVKRVKIFQKPQWWYLQRRLFFTVSEPSSVANVSKMHAQISYKDGAFFIVDLHIEYGTFIDHGGRRSSVPPNFPIGLRPSNVIEFGSDKKEWKMHLLIVLGCMDIDLALREEQLAPLTAENTPNVKRDFEMWDRSNRMSLIIMEHSIP
ncbi:hypothetical protein PVK06_043150 [Gossypium arboreum]|uniref:FHA domain-containing protein n=1 Tax=Gossypium arboreum TaxID=29729 RepID=A0ABR0MPS8_GOSAR|nr:hypothetical protein PVK06_043150 [Gossypium arboreum]